ETQLSSPDIATVLQLISRMDGWRLSQVGLRIEGRPDGRGGTIVIGGGDDGWFAIDLSVQQDEWMMIETEGTGNMRPITSGGQTVETPENGLCRVDDAKRIVEHFFHHAEPNPNFKWKQY